MGSVNVDVAVPARGVAEHAVPVKAGQRTAWEIAVSGDLDVSYSLRFEGNGGGSSAKTDIVPSTRCGNDTGSFLPPAAGRLVFSFDNSYSMLRSKSVTVSIATGDDNVDVLARDAILANQHVMKGIELFFTNRFDEAEVFFAGYKDKVPIHNLCWATLQFFRSLMTWEPEMITQAQLRLKETHGLAESWMPKEGVLSSIRGIVSLGGGGGKGEAANLPASPAASPARGGSESADSPAVSSSSSAAAGGMTPNQIEGTLVYAEATMLSALLSLMEESLMALVRCGLSIRSGWKVYLTADKALGGAVSRIKGESPQMQVLLADLARAAALFPRPAGAPAEGSLTGNVTPAPLTSPTGALVTPPTAPGHGHILGGVEFGMGAFNCLASILPPIVLKVISFLGFPSDRAAGMSQLRACFLAGGITTPLAALFLLAMRVLLPSFHSGDVTEHVPEAEAVLAPMLERYKDSALFLWLAGRLARMQGDVSRSHALLARCLAIKAWPQLAHLCEYELGWCAAFAHAWGEVLPRFGTLAAENAWSKVFYNYMRALALLQLGRLGEGREALCQVLRLWAGDTSRKLGNKVISADQYALRRSAEFVAYTRCVGPDGSQPEEDDAVVTSVLAASGADVSPTARRLTLPWSTPRGSPAHAAAMGAPVPLPGLECIYLFNGASQMDVGALTSAVAQCDAVLTSVLSGRVFDASQPVWKGQPSGQDTGLALWTEEANASASADAATPKSAQEVTALLQAAASVAARGWLDNSSNSGSGSGDVGSGGTPVEPGTPASVSSTGSGAKAGGGSGRFGFGSLMSSVTSGIRSTVSSAAAVANSATGGAISAAASGLGLSSGSSAAALPAYARPTPVLPVHTVTVAALVRGAMCAALGRIDEAAACFNWIVCESGANSGGNPAKRELHAYAYAQYELGVLYSDAAKALQQRASGASASSASASAGGNGVHSRKLAGLLTSQLVAGLSVAQCVALAKQHLTSARGVRDDFNWRVRLHLRVHLSMDDLRRRGKTGTGASGWGTTDWNLPSGGSGSASADETEEEEAEEELDDEAAGLDGAEVAGAMEGK